MHGSLTSRSVSSVHRRASADGIVLFVVLAALRAAAGKKCRDAKRGNTSFLPVFHLGFLLIWVRTYARVSNSF